MIASVRRAEPGDLGAITEIYNEAVLTTDASFDTEPKTEDEQRAWFIKHGPKHPIMVAEIDGTITGWASLSEWSDRRAYADTAEISLYVKEEHRSKGTGRRLLETIILEGEKVGLHSVVARIVAGNDVSVHLHESFGFEHIGIMREVGWKFGRLLDVVLMQKIYPFENPVRVEE
ncbi:MAG: N-acetyltransferase [Dehalococcoidales bacterium]|nr:N-acetyltransferase [Dehalococcoidales bacterium]